MIFDRMQEQGTLMIQQQPLAEYNLPNFFRVIMKGEKTELEDMSFYLDEIDRLGNDIDETMV